VHVLHRLAAQRKHPQAPVVTENALANERRGTWVKSLEKENENMRKIN